MGGRPGPACTPRGCAASPPAWLTARAAPICGHPRHLRSSPHPQHGLYPAYTPGAEAQFREALALGLRSGQPLYRLHLQLYLALLLAGSSDPAQRQEAWALASDDAIDRDRFHLGLALMARAKVAAGDGELAQAEAWARKACEQMASFRSAQRRTQTILSQVLLAQGRVTQAREEAALGVQILEQGGGEGYMAVGLRVALAEACLAAGDTAEGEQVLRRALQSVHEVARGIPEAAARERFLRQVPETVRALELARQHWGEA